MQVYQSSYPHERCEQPLNVFLWSLAQLWKWGSAFDRRRKLARVRSLPVPVVSVGNITAGGTGKTPVAIELLRAFLPAEPALLTRGHGRDTSETVLLPTGRESFPLALTGDEVQLYMRGAQVPIAIGSNRFETGERLLSAAPGIGMFFMDDGFQHQQLKRDFDLVLIDSLHAFGGGELLPLGRLREPLEGLSRADAFLLTRSDEAPNIAAIEHVLRQYNSRAPLFRSRVEARRFTNETGETIPTGGLKGLRAVAFCGLGNPRAFWRSLGQLGVEAMERIEYGDHHRYSPREFQRLVRHAKDIGAKALVTTGKDAVNLCPEFGRMAAPMPVYWLEIGVRIERREELVVLIEKIVLNGRGAA